MRSSDARPRSCRSPCSVTTARACTCHQSLWNGGEPLFYDESGYAGLSDIARWYIGGLLKHASAVLAFTNPSMNWYHRLVKGFEAPINLVYSAGNRSAAIRIPITGHEPEGEAHRIPCPRRLGQPVPRRSQRCSWLVSTASRTASSRSSRSTRTSTSFLPRRRGHPAGADARSKRRSRRCENRSRQFLLEGGVFTEDLINTWIDYKREHEITPLALRPHPHEFELYYGV